MLNCRVNTWCGTISVVPVRRYLPRNWTRPRMNFCGRLPCRPAGSCWTYPVCPATRSLGIPMQNLPDISDRRRRGPDQRISRRNRWTRCRIWRTGPEILPARFCPRHSGRIGETSPPGASHSWRSRVDPALLSFVEQHYFFFSCCVFYFPLHSTRSSMSVECVIRTSYKLNRECERKKTRVNHFWSLFV